MFKKILKILISSAIVISSAMTVMTAHAQFAVFQPIQGGTGAAGTLTGCLQGNGKSPFTSTGIPCGSGGSGGSASLPFGGVQFSVPNGTSTAFSASSSFTFSTSTGLVSAPSLSLTTPLGISSGGTNSNGSGFKTNGIMYYSGSQMLADPALYLSSGTLENENGASLGMQYGMNAVQSFYTGQNTVFGGSGTLGLQTFNSGAWHTYLDIINSGLIGIATTTPDTALSVDGTTTTKNLKISSLPNSLLGTDALGNVIATTTSAGGVTAVNATAPILSSGGATPTISCPSCISSTTPLIATAYLWVDGNRNALTYTANGSIQYPYQTIDAAIAAINTSGVPNATLEIVASSSPYVENNLTMPNIPMTIDAQNSTILTGFGGGTGTITFPNTFVWNGGTILGNVNETDISTSTPHTFQSDAVILGNLTCSGLCTLLNGAIQPNGITGATTTIYQNKGSLMNILGENVVSNIIDAGGTLNLNDDQVIANTSNYAVVATTTGSSVEVLGLTLVNTGGGGGFNVQNGATTVPNNLNNIIISENTGAIPVINNATTSTILSGYNAYSFTGTQQYAQGSGYIAPDNIGLQSDGTNNLGQNQGGIALGTTTIWNPLVASTFTETNLSSSTFKGSVISPCFATSTAGPCITGGGGGSGGGVTSVAMTTPTGLSISGSPITTSGTLGLTLTAGYVIPLTASTTQWASAYASTSALSGTSPVVYNGTTGAISCPTCNTTASNVISVSPSGTSLTISPTTGAVLASINLSNANTWTGTQTINNILFTNASGTNATTTNLTISGITGTTSCLQVNTNGVVSGIGSPCGSAAGGNGTVTSVAMTVPTGLSIGGSPITTSGTFGLTLTSGYNIPLTASTTNWDGIYNSITNNTAGYVLQASSTATNKVAWVATSTLGISGGGGGSSQWTGTAGGPIYYASPVSIGTSSYLYGLTIATDTDIDNGLFHASTTNNTITINTLQEGAPVFQTDAGVVSALDEPVDASATIGTLESYSFNNGGTPVLTIYGLSNGAGSTSNLGGGFGTTTPGQTLVDNGGFQLSSASSTVITPSISGAIVGLGCDSATSSVDVGISSSTTAFITTPQNYPGAGLTWQTYLSAPGVITTTVCSDVTVTPSASQYVVKIIR